MHPESIYEPYAAHPLAVCENDVRLEQLANTYSPRPESLLTAEDNVSQMSGPNDVHPSKQWFPR